MVVICAERLAIPDIERFIRKRFLYTERDACELDVKGREDKQETHVAGMTVEALAMVLALELTVGGRHRLLFDR